MKCAAGRIVLGVCAAVGLAWSAQFTHAQRLPSIFMPEERAIAPRDPCQLPHAALPQVPTPPTVIHPAASPTQWQLSLDEAIRIGLENAEVVRVLGGLTASSSGRTVYDTAIMSTSVDPQRARFDPTFAASNNWLHTDTAAADPLTSTLNGFQSDGYNLGVDLSKTTVTGGTARLGVNTNPQHYAYPRTGLDPEIRSSFELSFTQPLLEGGGWGPNMAPIFLAQIDTDRSFFQFKSSIQNLVLSVAQGYWAVVLARIDVWATQQQLEQAEFAYELARNRFELELDDASTVAQTRVSLENFRSSLLSAQQTELDREAALRNLLGLPPFDGSQLVPTTPPDTEQRDFQWESLIELAEQQRPDIIELKLIVEADEQLLLQARNRSQPRVDALALYRWNGLEGMLPSRTEVASSPGQFTDWSLGVNFSVPLGLRQARAQVRRQELLISRDWANLQQAVHSTVHILALRYRNLAHTYRQYEIAQERRSAARINLNAQLENYRISRAAGGGRTPYLSLLLAINDWGNAIRSEAQFLMQYNVELANLELETGTILESHGVRFYEERFGSLGPLGRLAEQQCYPSALRPTSNANRYPEGTEPSERSFNLQNPIERRPERIRLPADNLPPPR